MNLCLDTNLLIEVLRDRAPHYRRRLEEAGEAGAALKLSAVVLHELAVGARLSARPDLQLQRVRTLAGNFELHAWGAEDAMEAAAVRAELQGKGRSIGAYDTMIAGQCVARGWTLVTGNVRDFGQVRDLRILDWSDPAGPIDVTGAATRLRRPPKD